MLTLDEQNNSQVVDPCETQEKMAAQTAAESESDLILANSNKKRGLRLLGGQVSLSTHIHLVLS